MSLNMWLTVLLWFISFCVSFCQHFLYLQKRVKNTFPYNVHIKGMLLFVLCIEVRLWLLYNYYCYIVTQPWRLSGRVPTLNIWGHWFDFWLVSYQRFKNGTPKKRILKDLSLLSYPCGDGYYNYNWGLQSE